VTLGDEGSLLAKAQIDEDGGRRVQQADLIADVDPRMRIAHASGPAFLPFVPKPLVDACGGLRRKALSDMLVKVRASPNPISRQARECERS
jgi:hypothetical protein